MLFEDTEGGVLEGDKLSGILRSSSWFQAVLLPFILHSTYFLTFSLGIRRDSSQLPPSTRPLSIIENQVLMLARYEIYVPMDSDKLYFPVFYVLATPCRRTRGERHTKPCHPFSTVIVLLEVKRKYILRSRDGSREWPAVALITAGRGNPPLSTKEDTPEIDLLKSEIGIYKRMPIANPIADLIEYLDRHISMFPTPFARAAAIFKPIADTK